MEAKDRSETPHILLVSQKVKDIKVPRNGELEKHVYDLRRWLIKHGFIAELDKVPATVTPQSVKDGVLWADIHGRFLGSDLEIHPHIDIGFPLMLKDYAGPLEVETIFSNVEGVEIGDGGNIQNMIVNLALALHYATRDPDKGPPITISVASSSDPFARLPPDLADQLRRVCNVFTLDIPDRFAIQVPYEGEGHRGILAITSEPKRTNDALGPLLRNDDAFRAIFKEANCYVSADPIYEHLRRPYKDPPFTVVINATTAFRSLVASESFGRTVLLPMNQGEAGDVSKLLLQRGLEEELEKIERPPFPSPLNTRGDAIDIEALRVLDESVHKFTSYIPIRHPSFACPISFGASGGLIIGAEHDVLACFTSTPSEAGENILVDDYGDAAEVRSELEVVGAGDAVATIMTLFNVLDPRLFVLPHLEGRELKDRSLSELAGTIFVCALGRIVGSFLLRTRRTHWSTIRGEKFLALLDDVAKESLVAARQMLKALHAPAIAEIKKWGIKTVVWRPGRIAYPESMLS
jgi:hypothetical protein